MPCWEITVKGRVQGVGFRWFAVRLAEQVGIRGYVKNLANGAVRIMAIGELGDLDIFSQLIKQGSYPIRVDELDVMKLDRFTEYEDFFIA